MFTYLFCGSLGESKVQPPNLISSSAITIALLISTITMVHVHALSIKHIFVHVIQANDNNVLASIRILAHRRSMPGSADIKVLWGTWRKISILW